MQGVLRAFYAFKKLNKARIAYPDLVTVSVLDIQNFLKVAGTTPEPLALVNGVSLDLPASHPALTTIKGELPVKVLQAHGHVTSSFHSPTTVFPVNSAVEASAAGANRLDYLVVTIVDQASASKKDLIGQAVIKLAQVRNLSLGKPVTVTVRLESIKLDVKDANGESQVIAGRVPTGIITLSITRPLPSYNMSGPVYKVSDNKLALGAWKKRWFTLHNGQLSYFNSEFNLEAPKATIATNTITHIEECVENGRPAIKVVSKLQKGTPSVTWVLGFDEDGSKSIRRKWVRVLYRNAKQLTPPVEVSGKVLKRQAKEAAAKAAAAAPGSAPTTPKA